MLERGWREEYSSRSESWTSQLPATVHAGRPRGLARSHYPRCLHTTLTLACWRWAQIQVREWEVRTQQIPSALSLPEHSPPPPRSALAFTVMCTVGDHINQDLSFLVQVFSPSHYKCMQQEWGARTNERFYSSLVLFSFVVDEWKHLETIQNSCRSKKVKLPVRQPETSPEVHFPVLESHSYVYIWPPTLRFSLVLTCC